MYISLNSKLRDKIRELLDNIQMVMDKSSTIRKKEIDKANLPNSYTQDGSDIPEIRSKNEKLLSLQRYILKQQRQRKRILENIDKLQESKNLDGLNNLIYEYDRVN